LTDISDDELFSMFRAGDAEAFGTLFDRYHTSVYNYARTILDDSVSAEDILQETFLAVARAANKYQPRGRFRLWLMRIVRNRCLNYIQSERRRWAAVAEINLDIIKPASREPCPSDRVEINEEMRTVRRAIAELPERQREAIVLYAFEKLAYREIAEVLDMPMNTIKTLIHRARATLARTLVQSPKERPNGM